MTDNTTMADKISNITDTIKTMNDTTAIFILTIVNMVIIGLALLLYFFYTGTIFSNGLRKKGVSLMDTMYGSINGKIHSIEIQNPSFQYPLRDYYIKTAYNACSGGNYKNDYVDTDILKSVLKQGVRCLDFEIYSIDDTPVVATSTNDSYFVKETFNHINFSEVLDVINNYAFTMSSAPNPGDPLFIHLSIKSTNPKIFQSLTDLLDNFNKMNNRLLGTGYSYGNTNMAQVKLSDLGGKVIIMVDNSNKIFSGTKFNEYVNITSKSSILRGLTNYEIVYGNEMSELTNYNKINMTIAIPDKGTSPSNPNSLFIRNCGCQFIAMRYQMVDSFLEENNLFFEDNGSAFVLKPEKLRYQTVTIAAAPPQNPALSYAPKIADTGVMGIKLTI